ncbi:Fre2p [Sugiyamaella lignohabitans]|uniref:ferric-chelate reductase (NADPH) n=1 Tax=Sugiyamaella lignohabitans TaxID=796027 RepID=A0A167F2Q8_9ASCO|nr:Fre2p [Sugiyamaella lignohabitans]ANB14751.1 Fre2p [Sugiyamaella lignohabitans]
MSPAGKNRTSFAEICALSGDIINVRVRATVVWRPLPGEYVFIYINRKLWDAHPFSVVGPSSDGESFQLLCKARKGMTRRISKMLKSKGADKDHPSTIPVLIEGPYGVHCPVERYGEVLLIAGGVGITGVIPYVEYLTHSPDANPTRIKFVWAVQSRSDTRWIEERLLRLSNKVEIVVYAAARTAAKENQDVLKSFVYEDPLESDYPYANNNPYETDEKDPTTGKHAEFHFVGDDGDDNLSTTSSRYPESNDHDRERHDEKPQDLTSEYGRSLTLKVTGQRARPAVSGISSPKPPLPLPPKDFHGHMYGSMHTLNIEGTTAANSLVTKSHRRRLSRMEWYQRIQNGRADINTLVKEFFIGSSASACVLGCGPPPMMDTMRQSVAQHLDLNEHGRVDYFEEAYSW